MYITKYQIYFLSEFILLMYIRKIMQSYSSEKLMCKNYAERDKL
jgi:hypothetical protein